MSRLHSTPPSTSETSSFTSQNATFQTQLRNLAKCSYDRSSLPLASYVPLPTASAAVPNADNSHLTSSHSSNLQLLKLQIFIRHGPRTFLTSLPNYEMVHYDKLKDAFSDQQPYEWRCPPFTREYLQDHHFFGQQNSSELTKNLSFDLFYEKEENIIKGNCGAGQLTTIGWNYMERVGQMLRQRYGFLDAALRQQERRDAHRDPDADDGSDNADDELYIRTTDSHPRRTEDSTKAILMGWMPEIDSWRIFRVEPRREYFYNRESHCPRLRVLYKQYRQSKIVADEKERLLQKVEPRLRERLEMSPEQRMPSIRTLFNTIDCIRTDLKPLNLSKDEIDDVEEHAMWYYRGRYGSGDRLIGRLAISRVFDLIVQNIDARIQKDLKESTVHNGGAPQSSFANTFPFVSANIRSTPKRASAEIYVCHDQTLLPMLSVLYQKPRRFPGFGSWVAYETFKGTEDNEYYIRVVWDGQVLNLSGDTHGVNPKPLEEVTTYPGVHGLYKYEDFRKWCLEDVCFKSYKDACAPIPGEVIFAGTDEREEAY